MTEKFFGESFDEKRFDEDPRYRWAYLKQFLDFDESDWETLQTTENIIRPNIPSIVNDLYDVFRQFEPTADLYRDDSGAFDEKLLEDRTEGFELWFERIFESEDREDYVAYLAKVGAIHTQDVGFEDMFVDQAHLGPAFSWLLKRIGDELADEITDPEQLAKTLSAWQRFVTMQLSVFRMAYSDST